MVLKHSYCGYKIICQTCQHSIQLLSVLLANIHLVARHNHYRSIYADSNKGVILPHPVMITGREIKGTETCGHLENWAGYSPDDRLNNVAYSQYNLDM